MLDSPSWRELPVGKISRESTISLFSVVLAGIIHPSLAHAIEWSRVQTQVTAYSKPAARHRAGHTNHCLGRLLA
jgi:hypothetical protein